MAATVDIGTLSGRVNFEDNTSKALDAIIGRLDNLENKFGSVGHRVAESAAGFITAQAAIAAVERVASLAVETFQNLTLEGAAIADVADNFDHLAAGAGRLGDTLLGALREGTHNTIDDFQLMKLANADLAAGLNLTDDQFKVMAKSAFALSQATGEDMNSALEKVNDALLTGRTRGLQMLTGRIDLTQAEKDLAAQLGTTVERLTDEEKVQAARTATLEKLSEVTGRLGDQSDGLDEKVAQLQTSFKNWYDELARAVATSPAVIKAFDTISASVMSAFGGDGEILIKKITGAIDYFADQVTIYGPRVVDVFIQIKDWSVSSWNAISDAAATYGPTVIKWLTNIRDFVVDTATKAKDTWDALPDWFKKAAGEAVLYGAAAKIVVSATTSMTSGFVGLLGAIPEMATTISGIGPGMELLNKGLKGVGLAAVSTTAVLGPLALAIGGVTAALFAWEGATANTGRLREWSDSFEYAAMRLSGMSAAEADVAIATQHVNAEFMENEARLAEIRERLGETTGATKEQEDALIEQSNAQKLAATAAQIHAQQQKTLEETERRTSEEIRKFTEAMEEAELRSRPLATALNDLDGRLVEAAKYYLDLGMSVEKTSILLGTSAGVIERIKEVTTQQADAAKKAAEQAERQADAYNEITGRAKGFDKVMNGLSSTIQDQAKHLLGLGATSDQLSRALGITSEQAEALAGRFGSASMSASGFAGRLPEVGSALDQVKDKVMALNGELETLEEHQKRQSAGNSITYDLTTQEGLDYYKSLNTGATIGRTDQEIITAAKKGMSLQQMIQKGWINPYGNFTAFAEGGVVTEPTLGVFGEAGPEALIPLDKWDEMGGGGGGNVYNTFYVNGTGREVADTVSHELMKQLKLRRRFGAA